MAGRPQSRPGILRAGARVFTSADRRRRYLEAGDQALDVMIEQLEIGEPRERVDAARILISAACQQMALGEEGLDEPARRAAMLELLREPPPELLTMLAEAGVRLERDG